jgi:septal ring factor EnvC (AmiA/AmiB activator)
MNTPRRRLIRPTPTIAVQPSRQIAKLRERLQKERATLARWQARLKRAFNAVNKSQAQIARMERRLAQCKEE